MQWPVVKGCEHSKSLHVLCIETPDNPGVFKAPLTKDGVAGMTAGGCICSLWEALSATLVQPSRVEVLVHVHKGVHPLLVQRLVAHSSVSDLEQHSAPCMLLKALNPLVFTL